MRAVVLVGGEGTRLRPLTYDIPKQLLPLVEVPMLERSLEALAAHGVDEVVLSMGYRPDAFRAAFADGTCGGVRIDYAVESTPLDTGGGIAYAARHAGIDDTFLVLNGDVLHEFDLGELLALHRSSGAEATLAVTPVEAPDDYGLVVTADDGRVTAFVESGEPRDASMGNLINAGIYVFEPSMLDRLPPDTRLHIETSVFPVMAGEGVLFARAMEGWWIDVGTRERFLDATAHLLGDTSHVGAGADVASTASLTHAVVGAGSLVGDGATLEDSVLLPGAQVGQRAVVRRSILGRGATVGDDMAVEDEILACQGAA